MPMPMKAMVRCVLVTCETVPARRGPFSSICFFPRDGGRGAATLVVCARISVRPAEPRESRASGLSRKSKGCLWFAGALSGLVDDAFFIGPYWRRENWILGSFRGVQTVHRRRVWDSNRVKTSASRVVPMGCLPR